MWQSKSTVNGLIWNGKWTHNGLVTGKIKVKLILITSKWKWKWKWKTKMKMETKYGNSVLEIIYSKHVNLYRFVGISVSTWWKGWQVDDSGGSCVSYPTYISIRHLLGIEIRFLRMETQKWTQNALIEVSISICFKMYFGRYREGFQTIFKYLNFIFNCHSFIIFFGFIF